MACLHQETHTPSPDSPQACAQSVRDLVGRDFRGAIVESLAGSNEGIGDWNRSLSEVIAGLSADDLHAYELKSAESKDEWKKGLSREHMFKYLVSNSPEFMTRSTPLVAAYDMHVSPEFTKFAGMSLPMHRTATESFVQVGPTGNVALSNFDINDQSLAQLKEILSDFLTNVWARCRTLLTSAHRAQRGSPRWTWSQLDDYSLVKHGVYLRYDYFSNPHSLYPRIRVGQHILEQPSTIEVVGVPVGMGACVSLFASGLEALLCTSCLSSELVMPGGLAGSLIYPRPPFVPRGERIRLIQSVSPDSWSTPSAKPRPPNRPVRARAQVSRHATDVNNIVNRVFAWRAESPRTVVRVDARKSIG
ncbi:hypothetical protein NP233_g5572 [Leucocoprinus birnbaumii]|uniref:Uncharacterized protein n=1 Tax=Leucocoprinus birnbaumii TaxID=56174 RepID=A0AAD5YWL1_9AGAR|nr:hypothetical protein NP233_g5572 [Leucocoprinus birnbaumii]